MKLQIIVTHFNEPQGYVERFLDSIKVQDFIDHNEFEVLLVNDGDKNLISQDLLDRYKFSIKYFITDWGGISKARQLGQDNAIADYVMFCDCDDLFLRIDSFYKIFKVIDENKYDLILCGRLRDTGTELITKPARDQVLAHEIHCKVFRRQFLVDHAINWDASMTTWHEDFYFNSLVLCECPNIGYVDDTIYLWQARISSVSSLHNKKENEENDKRLVLLVSRYLVLLRELKTRNNKAFFNRKLAYVMILIYDINLTNKDLFNQIKQDLINLIEEFETDIMNLRRADINSAMKTLDINFVLKYNFAEKTFTSWWSEQNPKLAKLKDIK